MHNFASRTGLMCLVMDIIFTKTVHPMPTIPAVRPCCRLCASRFLFAVLIPVLAACSSQESDDAETAPSCDVTLSVMGSGLLPYETRAVENLADYCDYVNFVLYKGGSEVARAIQHSGDTGYGSASFRLSPGTYTVLVLAHRCMGGNPSVLDPTDIVFTDATRYDDTFCHYGEIVVGSQSASHSLTLSRASTKVMFHLSDAKPTGLGTCEIVYSGGTGHLNATTGHGTSTSTAQRKTVNLSSYDQIPDLNVYTFLPGDEGELDIDVTFKSTSGEVIQSRHFENVPVAHQRMTVLEGYFFSAEADFSIVAETDWVEFNRLPIETTAAAIAN